MLLVENEERKRENKGFIFFTKMKKIKEKINQINA